MNNFTEQKTIISTDDKNIKKEIFIMNIYDHTKIGGTETFDYLLTKCFKSKGYKVTSINEMETPKESIVRKSIFDDQVTIKGNILLSKIKFYFRFKNVKNKTIVLNSFRGIILMPKKFLKHNRVIVQQHYTAEIILKSINSGIKKKLFNKRVKYLDCFVAFSEADKNKFINKINKNKISVSALCTERPNINNVEKNNKYIYMGRLSNEQKNIIDLCNIFHDNKIEIDIYGYGPQQSDVEELSQTSNYVQYKGLAKSDEVKEILSKYKANIMYSDFEGMPFSIIESSSVNTPTITTNCFDSAKEMFFNEKIGVLTSKEKFIEEVINFKSSNHDAIKEYEEKYSSESFTKRWIKIIE